MNKLLVIGGGEHGKVVKEMASQFYSKIDFLDDRAEDAVGKFADYLNFTQDYRYAFVALGNSALRAEWLDKLQKAGYEVPVIIHPFTYVSRSAALAPGVIVEAGAVVNTYAKVGRGTIIGVNVAVDHDAVVGECCIVPYTAAR